MIEKIVTRKKARDLEMVKTTEIAIAGIIHANPLPYHPAARCLRLYAPVDARHYNSGGENSQ